MAMLDNLFGGLAKLTILGFPNDKTKIPNRKIAALYNPQSITLTYISQVEDSKSINQEKTTEFRKSEATTLALSLICDSTLPDNTKSVNAQIADLAEICCQIDGATKEPRFLEINWGGMKWGGRDAFSGSATNFEVVYNQFNRDGSPTRATVNLKLMAKDNSVVAKSLASINMPSVLSFTIPPLGDLVMLASLFPEMLSMAKTNVYLAMAFFNDLDNLGDFVAGDVLLGGLEDFISFGI